MKCTLTVHCVATQKHCTSSLAVTMKVYTSSKYMAVFTWRHKLSLTSVAGSSDVAVMSNSLSLWSPAPGAWWYSVFIFDTWAKGKCYIVSTHGPCTKRHSFALCCTSTTNSWWHTLAPGVLWPRKLSLPLVAQSPTLSSLLCQELSLMSLLTFTTAALSITSRRSRLSLSHQCESRGTIYPWPS